MKHEFNQTFRRLVRARLRYEDQVAACAPLPERMDSLIHLNQARVDMAQIRNRIF